MYRSTGHRTPLSPWRKGVRNELNDLYALGSVLQGRVSNYFALTEPGGDEIRIKRYDKAIHVLGPTLDELPRKTARLIEQEIKIAVGLKD